MVGGKGNVREDCVRNISTTNIFSALESRRKKSIKKKPDKAKEDLTGSSLPPIVPEPVALPSWTRTPVSVTSWADCEDDDTEYFAIPALPPLSSLDEDAAQESAKEPAEEHANENSEFSDEEVSEGYDDMEEGNEENKEPPLHDSTVIETSLDSRPVRREPDRQMSKKELKKKGLEDLEATFYELGLNQVTKKAGDSIKLLTTKEAANGNCSRPEANSSSVNSSKSFKRRKAKKENSYKDLNQNEPYHGVAEPSVDIHEATAGYQDKSESLKKASLVKKKRSKDGNVAARAVAAEAAIRASKLAAAKKKEKNHYNQQPR